MSMPATVRQLWKNIHSSPIAKSNIRFTQRTNKRKQKPHLKTRGIKLLEYLTFPSFSLAHFHNCDRFQNHWKMFNSHDGGRYHIETSPLICWANQWTGFYMITASVMKELSFFCDWSPTCFSTFVISRCCDWKKGSSAIVYRIECDFLSFLSNLGGTQGIF